MLADGRYGYFQHVGNDESQLSSAVIRVFRGTYSPQSCPDPNVVVETEVQFYAHVFLKAGYTLNIWEKCGTALHSGWEGVWFYSSNEIGGPEISLSHDWDVWQVNRPRKRYRILGRFQSIGFEGDVFPPAAIAGRISTGKYPGFHRRAGGFLSWLLGRRN